METAYDGRQIVGIDLHRQPQPYAGKVTSLRQLTGELSAEITMISEVIADLLAGDRGYQVIVALPGIGPVLGAVIIAEIGDVTRFRTAAHLCSWGRADTAAPRVRRQGHPRAPHQARVTAVALGGDRGDPAGTGGFGDRCPQGRHHRPARAPGAQHRQGRRRSAAAHPGLLRDARRADPLPGPGP